MKNEILEKLIIEFASFLDNLEEGYIPTPESIRRGRDLLKQYSAKCVSKVQPASFLVHWNKYITLPTVKFMSGERKGKLRARCQEQFFLDNWQEGIKRVAASSFCTGNNDRGWKADIDFFLRPATLAKVIEGKYDDKVTPTQRINHATNDTPVAEYAKQWSLDDEPLF